MSSVVRFSSHPPRTVRLETDGEEVAHARRRS